MSTRASIIFTLLVLGALWGLHEYDKGVEVARIKKEYADKSAEVITRTERATTALEASHVKEVQEKDEKINRISADLDVAIKRLQHRPLRASNPNTTSSPSSCRGSELYREDAEFLTREAARAEKLIEQRDYYYREYENARRELNGINERQTGR